MTKFVLYVEGGGNQSDSKALLRQAFVRLFSSALANRGVYRKPKIVVCGSIQQTLKHFESAVSTATDGICAVLVDADGPVETGRDPAAHLSENHGWAKPKQSTAEQIHRMVQTMEAWIVADRDAIQEYYGGGVHLNSLSNRKNVEEIPKLELERGLKQATRSTKKGEYHKIRHACQLLPRISAAKVAARAQHFKRLLDFMASRLGS